MNDNNKKHNFIEVPLWSVEFRVRRNIYGTGIVNFNN